MNAPITDRRIAIQIALGEIDTASEALTAVATLLNGCELAEDLPAPHQLASLIQMCVAPLAEAIETITTQAR